MNRETTQIGSLFEKTSMSFSFLAEIVSATVEHGVAFGGRFIKMRLESMEIYTGEPA